MCELIVNTEYDKSSRFGLCFINQSSFLVILFSSIVPVFLTFFIAITLDAYISIKAYQVYKGIQKENGKYKQVSKDKLNKILRQLKPVITLLVNVLGNTTYHNSDHEYH